MPGDLVVLRPYSVHRLPSRLAPGRRHPLAGYRLPLRRRWRPLEEVLAERWSRLPSYQRWEAREYG